MTQYPWRFMLSLLLILVGMVWVLVLNFTNIDSTPQRILVDHWLQCLGIGATMYLALRVLPSAESD